MPSSFPGCQGKVRVQVTICWWEQVDNPLPCPEDILLGPWAFDKTHFPHLLCKFTSYVLSLLGTRYLWNRKQGKQSWVADVLQSCLTDQNINYFMGFIYEPYYVMHYRKLHLIVSRLLLRMLLIISMIQMQEITGPLAMQYERVKKIWTKISDF